jgi:hypothetical protein|tara:strand:+ start:214 stop:339 length:126 start_codon:yes stop_codon:yes gene_type:complete
MLEPTANTWRKGSFITGESFDMQKSEAFKYAIVGTMFAIPL